MTPEPAWRGSINTHPCSELNSALGTSCIPLDHVPDSARRNMPVTVDDIGSDDTRQGLGCLRLNRLLRGARGRSGAGHLYSGPLLVNAGGAKPPFETPTVDSYSDELALFWRPSSISPHWANPRFIVCDDVSVRSNS